MRSCSQHVFFFGNSFWYCFLQVQKWSDTSLDSKWFYLELLSNRIPDGSNILLSNPRSRDDLRGVRSTLDCLLVHHFCFLNDFMIVLGDFHVFFLIRKVHHGTKKIEYEKTWRFLQLPYSERKNLGRFFFLFLSVVTAGMKISGRIHSGKEMLKGTYFLKDNIIVPFDGFQIRAMAASIWLDFERILFAEKEGWLVESIIFLFTYFFVLFVWPLPPECLLL